MYGLVSRVGSNYGVLDTSDGALEWLDAEVVKSLIQRGIQIKGIEGGNITPQTMELSYKLCNWAEGKNVFLVGRSTLVNNDSFQFIAGKKKFKGKIVSRDANIVTLLFSFNVLVRLPFVDFEALCNR